MCASPELLQLLPACVLVALQGGVGAALHTPPPHTASSAPSADPDTAEKESEAVADALECLVAVAGSCSDSLSQREGGGEAVTGMASGGARAVLEAGGLTAAVAAATAAVTTTLAASGAQAAPASAPASAPAPAGSRGGGRGVGGPPVGQRVALLALQLAGSLLQPAGSGALDLELRREVIAGVVMGRVVRVTSAAHTVDQAVCECLGGMCATSPDTARRTRHAPYSGCCLDKRASHASWSPVPGAWGLPIPFTSSSCPGRVAPAS